MEAALCSLSLKICATSVCDGGGLSCSDQIRKTGSQTQKHLDNCQNKIDEMTDETFCCQCDFLDFFLNLGEITDTHLGAFLRLGSTVKIEGRRNKKEFIVCSQGVEVEEDYSRRGLGEAGRWGTSAK